MLTEYNELLLSEDRVISCLDSRTHRYSGTARRFYSFYPDPKPEVAHSGLTMRAKKQDVFSDDQLIDLIEPNGNKSKAVRKKYYNRYKYKYGLEYIEGGDKNDDYIYYDFYKGKRRLNISLHGNVINSHTGKMGVVFVNGEQFDFRKIIEISNRALEKNSFHSIRLLTCHSAEGGSGSLIYNVSKALQIPVKGYIGEVTGYIPFRQAVEAGNSHQIYVAAGRTPHVTAFTDHDGYERYARSGQSVIAGLEFF